MNILTSIKVVIRFLNKLRNYSKKSYNPRYRVINIHKDEFGKYIATIQIIGKGITYNHRPEDILAKDDFVDFLSPRDVRTLTYLGYLEINQPEYKLLAKRLADNNQEIFVIKKRGESKVITKTIEEINDSNEIINKMTAEDANKIGYATGSLEVIEEKLQKEKALREFKWQNSVTQKIFKIGTTADYPPFSYVNLDKYVGFDIDIIKEIFCDLSLKFEFIKTSWSNLNHDLLSGKFDMAVGGISLIEDRSDFLFSTAIMFDGKTLLTTKKYENKIKSFSDIDKNKFTIVENIGGTNEKFVKENIKNAKVIFLENNLEIFERLAEGEFDFMFTDLSEALHREMLDERLLVIRPINLYTKPLGYGFIFNKNNEELRNYINPSLEKLINSEKFKEISYKYFKCVR